MAQLPLYQQIKNFITENIHNGQYQTDMKIPSEAELGETFKTSRMTVNRALRELTADGILIRKQGQGSFVAPHRSISALLEVRSIADEIQERGGDYSCHVHLLSEEKVNPAIAQAMQLSPYSPVFHSILVHRDNGIPIQLADRYTVIPMHQYGVKNRGVGAELHCLRYCWIDLFLTQQMDMTGIVTTSFLNFISN